MACSRWMAAFAAIVLAGAPALLAQSPAEQRVAKDLSVLAADSLQGRFTGSREAEVAADYLRRRFAEIGAEPPESGWLQSFQVSAGVPGLAGVAEIHRPRRGTNVIGVIPGRDPAVRDEFVVVGAHYDHLGLGLLGVHSPEQVGKVHNGADDNASGTAALLEIGRRLAERPARRGVVLVAFAGEEFGLIGSDAYVKSPAVPLDRTIAMVNLDMVGRLRSDRLLVFGAETAAEFPALLDSLNRGPRFDLQASGDGWGRSDQQSFYAARKPVLHMFTDLHEDYHRPSDDAERINVAGLVKVAAYTESVVRSLADGTAPLTFVDRPQPVAAGPARTGGYGAYLGSIPDMASGGPGVRLSGVTAGSPADQAGLREGDVLLRIGEVDVGDLQGMTDALRAQAPGDTVTVLFRRGTAVDSARVVLGSRARR